MNGKIKPSRAASPEAASMTKTVVASVASGAILGILGFVSLGVLNSVTGGTIVSWMGGMTATTDSVNFSTATTEPIVIPNLKKAKFCALTSVFIAKDTSGQCSVTYDDNKKAWTYFNAVGSNCWFACVY